MDYSDFYVFRKAKSSLFSCCSDSDTTLKDDELLVDEHNNGVDGILSPLFCGSIADGFDSCELCDIKNVDQPTIFSNTVGDIDKHEEFQTTSISEFKFDKLCKPTGIVVDKDGLTPISDVLDRITMLTFNTGLLELRLLGMQVYQNPPFTQRRLMHMPGELSNANSDVIALQEVYAKSHAHFLTAHMKSKYPYIVRSNFIDREFIVKHNITFSRPNVYHSKFRNKTLFHHGLMFLSKFPIIFAKFHSWRDVTHLEGIFGNKGFMEVICDVPSVGLVTFFNIHMASAALNPESKQVEQLRLAEVKQLFEAISIAIENKTIPIVIGDLNASPDNCASNYHYFLEQGWIDSWNVTKRRKSTRIRRGGNTGINSGLCKTIQSLKIPFSDNSRLMQTNRQARFQMPLSTRKSNKKLSLRVKDFQDPLTKSVKVPIISEKSFAGANCRNCSDDGRSIVDRLNNIGIGNNNKNSLMAKNNVNNNTGCILRVSKTVDRLEHARCDFKRCSTSLVDTSDNFVFKRSNSWHLFTTQAHTALDTAFEDDYSHLEKIQTISFECPETYNLKNSSQTSIKMLDQKTSNCSVFNETGFDSGGSYSYSGRIRGSSSITLYKGSYRVNFFSKYNRFDNYHRKSYSPNNRLPGYTQFGRRRILAIKKSNNIDEYTWDPMNPLNKIGPHSSCSGLRCDYIFLPPPSAARKLLQYAPKWSEIMFTEPCVLVDHDLQNCNFAYGICMSMKKLMLVTISDHYALKIVLVHKGSALKS